MFSGRVRAHLSARVRANLSARVRAHTCYAKAKKGELKGQLCRGGELLDRILSREKSKVMLLLY
ncbi:Protein kinase, catalytic domain-containing protein [Senna tora]|uniref:Protein kinase, catalytic domain-containing protein n=1 Tax=Senna tora TaxID=362788 RepID=A0A834SYT8_9FABA|nr:Protein kinase, catalytic domain-containing protein [Senna tora]